MKAAAVRLDDCVVGFIGSFMKRRHKLEAQQRLNTDRKLCKVYASLDCRGGLADR